MHVGLAAWVLLSEMVSWEIRLTEIFVSTASYLSRGRHFFLLSLTLFLFSCWSPFKTQNQYISMLSWSSEIHKPWILNCKNYSWKTSIKSPYQHCKSISHTVVFYCFGQFDFKNLKAWGFCISSVRLFNSFI